MHETEHKLEKLVGKWEIIQSEQTESFHSSTHESVQLRLAFAGSGGGLRHN